MRALLNELGGVQFANEYLAEPLPRPAIRVVVPAEVQQIRLNITV